MNIKSKNRYLIIYQNEYITESVQCRDGVREKLRKATDDLTNLINEVTSDEIKALKEYTDAVEYLNQSSELFAKLNN
jgi:hypothetical protein